MTRVQIPASTSRVDEARDAFRHALEAAPALDPKFKDSVGPNDTLWVFAKAAHGPPMPLAITRLTAAQLPASVTLTGAMGMVPSLTLSQFPQIVASARISKSGNAIAQSGDFQTQSASTATAQTEPVQLIIAERVD